MWARSSLCSLVVLAGACRKPAPKPEADPAKVKALAATMVDNSPVPAGADRCKDPDFTAPVTMTFRTLQRLAGQKLDSSPESSDWANPPVLDTAAAQTLLDDAADTTAKRQAAGELVAASAWIVYRVDLVNAPMALGVKELKTGFLNARVIRYDRSGRPACVTPFVSENTPDKTSWAISVSQKPYVEPAVAKILREDLAAQFVAAVPHAKPAAPH